MVSGEVAVSSEFVFLLSGTFEFCVVVDVFICFSKQIPYIHEMFSIVLFSAFFSLQVEPLKRGVLVLVVGAKT